MSSHDDTHDETGSNRRDFLTIAGPAFAAIGGALTLWPFISQMNPDAGALALASTEVDLAPVKEGQAITVQWRGKPVFIRNRTKAEIEDARAAALRELPDPQADAARVKKDSENWLVVVGVCTHLGCIPKGQTLAEVSLRGDYKGWFCPCHGSHYDTSGRIRKGPAPKNLEVPPYVFMDDKKTKIKIG